MPAISVIIPVHNGEKTIAETVQSVLNQSFSDFELIVVNSGSSDRTAAQLATFSDPRIQVVTCPKATAAANRNRGVSHSSGDYVAFLDADDLWSPQKLALQYQALQDHPEAAVAYCWTNCIDVQGKYLRHCSFVYWTGNVLPYLLLDDFIGSGSNVLIQQQAFVDVGGFDEQLTNAEDTDLWLRLAAKYAFTVVPSPQVFYRVSLNSKSSNLTPLEACNLKIIERSFAAAPAALHYLKPHRVANLYKYLAYKSLDVLPGQHHPLRVTRLLYLALKTDPGLIKTPIIYKAILKLLTLTFLPPQLAQVMLTKYPRLSNISTFLGYGKFDVRSVSSVDRHKGNA